MISDVGDNEIVSEVVIMTMADTAHGPDWILCRLPSETAICATFGGQCVT